MIWKAQIKEEELIPEPKYQHTNWCSACGQIIWPEDRTNDDGDKHIECTDED